MPVTFNPSTRSRYILILVYLVLALLGLLFIRNLVDFPVYYAAGQSLLSGRTDLYASDFALGRVMDYRYLPLFLILFMPLWLVPYSTSAFIWYLLCIFEITACVIVIRRVFPSLSGSWKMWLLIALSTSQYFVMAIHYGNVHLLAIALLFGCFYFLTNGRDTIAGLLMAFAITLKMTPVVLLPYFAVKRRWKMLGMVVIFLAALNIAPALYFGFSQNIRLIRMWYDHVISSQEFHEDNGPINLSLKGELRRYLSMIDYSKRVDGDVQYPEINVGSFSRETIEPIWIVFSSIAFVLAILIVLARGDPSQRVIEQKELTNQRFSGEIALMLCLMLFVGPLTSKIYFVALLWPVAHLASIAERNKSRNAQLATGVLLIVAVANSVLPLLPGRSVQRLLLVVGVDFYLNCLVMAAVALLLIASYRVIRSQSGEPQMRVQSAAKAP